MQPSQTDHGNETEARSVLHLYARIAVAPHIDWKRGGGSRGSQRFKTLLLTLRSHQPSAARGRNHMVPGLVIAVALEANVSDMLRSVIACPPREYLHTVGHADEKNAEDDE
jgi:hypothetical protein